MGQVLRASCYDLEGGVRYTIDADYEEVLVGGQAAHVESHVEPYAVEADEYPGDKIQLLLLTCRMRYKPGEWPRIGLETMLCLSPTTITAPGVTDTSHALPPISQSINHTWPQNNGRVSHNKAHHRQPNSSLSHAMHIISSQPNHGPLHTPHITRHYTISIPSLIPRLYFSEKQLLSTPPDRGAAIIRSAS